MECLIYVVSILETDLCVVLHQLTLENIFPPGLVLHKEKATYM